MLRFRYAADYADMAAHAARQQLMRTESAAETLASYALLQARALLCAR